MALLAAVDRREGFYRTVAVLASYFIPVDSEPLDRFDHSNRAFEHAFVGRVDHDHSHGLGQIYYLDVSVGRNPKQEQDPVGPDKEPAAREKEPTQDQDR